MYTTIGFNTRPGMGFLQLRPRVRVQESTTNALSNHSIKRAIKESTKQSIDLAVFHTTISGARRTALPRNMPYCTNVPTVVFRVAEADDHWETLGRAVGIETYRHLKPNFQTLPGPADRLPTLVFPPTPCRVLNRVNPPAATQPGPLTGY